MTEQEQVNYLIARFLRLNDEGKNYVDASIRELAHICKPVKPDYCSLLPKYAPRI